MRDASAAPTRARGRGAQLIRRLARRRWRGPPPGFTLAELMVVILVLGVSLAVVAPSLPHVSGGEEGVQELTRLLRRGRQAAVAGGTPVAVDFAASPGRYHMRRWAPDAGVVGPRVGAEPAPELLLERGPLPAGLAVAADPPGAAPVLVFGPRGRTSGPALRVLRSGRRVDTALVDPWTGRIDVRR